MTAAVADRKAPQIDVNSVLVLPVAAATTIYAGTLVALNTSGYAVPASASASLQVLGWAQTRADNSGGGAGAISVNVMQGAAAFVNGDGIAAVNAGSLVYAMDDQTVSLGTGSGARPAAGVVLGMLGTLVEVDVGASTPAAGWGTYLRTVRTVTPHGNSGDAARGQAALTEMAGIGEVLFGPGTHDIRTPMIVPNGSIIVGTPNTSFVQTMAVTGGHTNTTFSRDDVSTPTVTSAITADAVPGSKQITVPAALSISVGDTVALSNGNQIATFSVTAYTSTTMTLDRVVLYAFPSGTQLLKFAQPRDIKIYGNGMQMNGTGDRYVSIVSGWRCIIEDIRVKDGTASEYFFSLDSGSRESEFRKIIVDGGAVTAIAIEGAEKCAMVDCHVENITNDPGLLFQAAYDCEARNCSARGCTGAGLSFGFTLDPVGSRGGRVIGGSFHGNGTGLKIDGGSRDCEFIGVDCSYNTGAGILCQRASSLTPGRIRVHGARLVGNDYGILVDYAQGCYATEVYTQGSKTNAVRTVNGAEITIHGLECQEDGNHPGGALTIAVASYDTSILRVIGGKVASAKAAGINCFQSGATSRMELANVTAKNPASNGIGFANGGGVLILRDCATEGCSIGSYAGGLGSNSSTRLEGRVDLSSATTPITNDTLGCHNRGTVTLNGTSGVDYTFYDIKSGSDSVKLTRKTTSGTPNVTAPTWVFATNKVTVTGTIAGTGDVYSIEIG